MTTRVIALVDMDCFYCQVEEKLNPDLLGKPVAVVQYNLWREGGIIAANYLAKEKGVTKGMWKHEAKDLCPELQFARVAELRGRADLTKYRDAGNQVVDVLSTFTNLLERASIDEAYLDLTEAVQQELLRGISNIPLEKLKTTHIVGQNITEFISNISRDQDTDGFCEDDLKLAIGGIIVERIRASIYEKTGYICSAGIAHNKILAKLVCGLHKPNKQTILPGSAVTQYFAELPLKKIKRLGGKFGRKVSEELNIKNVGELLQFSEKDLTKKFDLKTGHWLYNIAKGIDNEPVSPKILSKSLSCCKRFPGTNALFKQKDVEYWIKELAIEVAERLVKDRKSNNRKAKMVTVSFVQDVNKKDVSSSKTFALRAYDADIIALDAFELLRKSDGSYYLKYLGISVGSFEEIKNIKDIKFFFGLKQSQMEKSLSNEVDVGTNNESAQEEIEQVQSSQIADQQNDTNKSSSIYCDSTSGKSIISDDIILSDNEINEIEHVQSPQIADHQNITNKPSSINCDSTSRISIISDKTILSDNEINDVECNHEIIDSEQIFENAHTHSRIEEVVDCNAANSFFTRYFKNTTNEIISDTTKDSSLIVLENNDDFHESIDNIDNQGIIFQKCEDCGEEISIEDIGSHSDYHFALKLQREDSSAEKTEIKIKTLDQSSKKRKAIEFGNGSIERFLTTFKSSNKEATEMCETCNKKVRTSELLSHFDYHAAKNLHKMLNSQNRSYDGISNERKNESFTGNGILRYLKRKSS